MRYLCPSKILLKAAKTEIKASHPSLSFENLGQFYLPLENLSGKPLHCSYSQEDTLDTTKVSQFNFPLSMLVYHRKMKVLFIKKNKIREPQVNLSKTSYHYLVTHLPKCFGSLIGWTGLHGPYKKCEIQSFRKVPACEGGA